MLENVELTRGRIRRTAIPAAAALLVGFASTVPSSFPTQTLFETLVIAQASLLAIVISVSMMSMQVSTSRFAPQLSQLYRESSFGVIIARFGLSILVDLALFALPATWATDVPTRAVVVGLVVGLASWAFVSLLDIEERLLVFLNPDPVLDELVEAVSFERYYRFSERRREEGRVTRNPILEIFQVAETSLEQRDNYGALRAVEALDEATERILSGYASLPDERRRAAADSVHKLFDYWNRVADLAVEDGADDVLHAIDDAEGAIGREAIDLELTAAATGAVDAVYHFCAVTLANNRLEAEYHATLGDLLSASLEAGLLDVARRAVTDLARLSQLVDRREDDLLVAHDERIAPHEEFFDNWAYFLSVHHPRLGTDQCQSLYVHFEAQYGRIREEAIDDGRTGYLADAAVPGFRDVGVAAAEGDVQWVASRATEHLLDLALLTDRSPEAYGIEVERIVAAGGGEGVEDAVARLRTRLELADEGDGPDRASTVVDPVSDRGVDAADTDPGAAAHLRPVGDDGGSDDVARYLDAVEAVLADTTATPADE